MTVHSDILTTADLYACLPRDVAIAAIRELKNPRKRTRGWELSLEGVGNRHTRRRNSGMCGANGYGYAATWDDHGEWMAALYEIDPDAAIAWYRNRDHFYEATESVAKWRQRSRLAAIRDTGRAPWLKHIRVDRADRVARLNAVQSGSWGGRMTWREYRQDDVRDAGYCPRCGQPLSAMTTGARGYCETHGWQYANWHRAVAEATRRALGNLTPGVMTGEENQR